MEDRLVHSGSRRDSNLMRSVNTNLRQRSESLSGAEPIAFFCECASPSCYSPLWMSATVFDGKLMDQPGWMLHEGHEPSALWHRREPLPTRTSLRARPAPEPDTTEPRKLHGRPRLRPLTARRVGLPHRDHAEAA
jgi:hypothetical protein